MKLFAVSPLRCPVCALARQAEVADCPHCKGHTGAADRTFAAVPYSYPWIALIQAFKFQNASGWAHLFARLLRATPGVNTALAGAHSVLPMPLSVPRLRERGYNQALLLARALNSGKLRTDALRRIRDTPPQSTLRREERLRNVHDAYQVPTQSVGCVRGRHIVLIDDVMTSGASLLEATTALRRAGAAHVCAMVVARAE